MIAKGLTADKVKTGTGITTWNTEGILRILRNEKYCGDILMQKSVTLDFLTHKRVSNKGIQPQYFVEDHHPAIISKEVWKAAQIKLDHRSMMHNQNISDIKQKHSDKTVFSSTLYCGVCGSLAMRRTFRSSRNNSMYSYYAWRCRVADRRKEGEECDVRNYREESMKHAFMSMLLDMKCSQREWTREVEDFIAEKDLDDWEKERMDHLKIKIESLHEQLGQVENSDHKNVARDIYNDIGLDLTQEIDVLQNEWDMLNKKKNEAQQIKDNLEWFIGELNSMKNFYPTYECLNFREDIFKRIVDRGNIYDDGIISYELEIGITRKSTGNSQKTGKLRNIENR